MARFKKYDYSQGKFLAIKFHEQIFPDTFEFALSYIIDSMDLTVFDQRYKNDETGAPAFDPAILLKIILYAYSRGIFTSRDIARACRENVVFMALSADTRPHFTTIADFISTMGEEITPLFCSVLLICEEEGLIGTDMFAIDGSKISSNASKEWSGNRDDFERKSKKLEKTIRTLLRKHRNNDDDDDLPPLMRAKEQQAIKRLHTKVNKYKKWLAENEDKRGPSGKVKKSNIIDNDSAKMASSHGVIQGYNGVAAVDAKHQVIVHAEAFGEGQESGLLKPMLQGVRDNFKCIGQKQDVLTRVKLTADSGYHSEKNVKMLFDENIEAYVADRNFRKRDPRFDSAKRHKKPVDRKGARKSTRYFKASDFKYNAAKGKLICPAGKELYLKNRNFCDSKGLKGVSYMAKKTDCRVCKIRDKCLRKPHTVARQVTIFSGHRMDKVKNYTQQMIERFDSAKGRHVYSRRMGTVEPIFAHIRHAMGLHRFTLRGNLKVSIQWKLYCIVHNLKKIHRYAFEEG